MNNGNALPVRGGTYAFLANALRYPDSDILQILADPACLSAWKLGVDQHCPDLSPFIRDVQAQLDLCSDEDSAARRQLEESFIGLFGHTVRGSCPPYEFEYGKAEIIQQAGALADIQGFYEAFGLVMIDGANERIDHACAECEFMGALAAKQSHAAEHAGAEAVQILADAQKSFLADHMGQWFKAFGRRLQETDKNGFYGAVGALAAEFIQGECEIFDVPCGPEFLELREPDPENDCSMTCGVESSCPGARQSS